MNANITKNSKQREYDAKAEDAFQNYIAAKNAPGATETDRSVARSFYNDKITEYRDRYSVAGS